MNASIDSEILIVLKWWNLMDQWLEEHRKSQLSDTSRLLLEKLENAKNRGDWKKVWEIIESLKKFSDVSNDPYSYADTEIGIVRLNCAKVAIEMGALNEAVSLLKEALIKFTRFKDEGAITEWLMGCVYWILPGYQYEAIVRWQHSHNFFKGQYDRSGQDKDAFKRYAQRCKIIKEAIQKAVEHDRISEPPTTETESTSSEIQEADEADNTSNPVTQPVTVTRSTSAQGGYLELFNIVGSIPAGGFGTFGTRPFEIASSVEVEIVQIDNKPYQVIPLRKGDRKVNILYKDHFVVQVTGNSMNREGILPGDYVLIRLQNDAAAQDIVAVARNEADETWTLKRFVRKNGRILLQPNSDNPGYETIELDSRDNPMIVGVALAVFKPC